MTTQVSPIAFLGLGRMGLPMSQNLARAGFAVRAWNRSDRSGVEPAGTDYTLLPTPAAAAEGASVIFTMLPDLAEVRQVCAGPQGALSTAAAGAVIVVLGTVSPVGVRQWATEVAASGFRVVDAPVSGGDVGARDALLSIMIGGADADVAAVTEPLQAMGSVLRHLGPLGAGQLAKACNQIVVATTLTALGEAITLGTRGGLDVDQLLDILAGGLAGSRVLEVKRELFSSHSFVPGGSASFQHKDLGFALEAGREGSVALPVTAVVDQLFGAMRWTGRGENDHSGILQITELLSEPSTSADRTPEPGQ
jgi:2-hydroxy-3-oxopropionate reductase